VTWTVPSDWIKAKAGVIYNDAPTFPHAQRELFWTRFHVTSVLDAAVTLNSITSLNKSTKYAELVTGVPLETGVHRGPSGIGCIEALTDAGTAKLIVNCASKGSSFA
jgi:hypothetical protein